MGFGSYPNPWGSAAFAAGAAVWDRYRQKSAVSKTITRVITDREEEDPMSQGIYSMSRRSIRRGRKMPYDKYVDQVVAQNIVHTKERFGAITDPSDTVGNNRGAYFLNHGQVSATTNITIDGAAFGGYMQYPIHVWSLNNTSQNPTAVSANNVGNGAYELIGGTAGGTIPGKLAWKRLGGWSNGVVVGVGTYPIGPTPTVFDIVAPELVDNETNDTNITLGRQAMLEWFNFKTLFYGKKTRPTYITVSLVSFLEEKLTPDYWYQQSSSSTTSSNEARTIGGVADEFWRNRLRKLIANPCSAGVTINHEKKMIVYARKVIKLAPKESIDSDSDPHQQFVNWFERVNQKVDFSFHFDGTADAINDTLTANPNWIPTPEEQIGQMPSNKLWQNKYLVVESYAPDQVAWTYNAAGGGTAPTNSTVASYDAMLTKSWAKIP